MIFEYAHNSDCLLKKPHLIDEDKYDLVNLHCGLKVGDKKTFRKSQVHPSIVDQLPQSPGVLLWYLESRIWGRFEISFLRIDPEE